MKGQRAMQRELAQYIVEPIRKSIEVPRDVLTVDNETKLADYIKQINNLQGEIEANLALMKPYAQVCLERAFKLGEILNECCLLIPYGQFGKWLETNIKTISPATAYRYMKLAELSPVINLNECEGLKDAYKQIEDHEEREKEMKSEPAEKKPKPEKSLSEKIAAHTGAIQTLLYDHSEDPAVEQLKDLSEIYTAYTTKFPRGNRREDDESKALPFDGVSRTQVESFIKRCSPIRADSFRWYVDNATVTFQEISRDKKLMAIITMAGFHYEGDEKEIRFEDSIIDLLRGFSKKDLLTFKGVGDKLILSNGATKIVYAQCDPSQLDTKPKLISSVEPDLIIPLTRQTITAMMNVMATMKKYHHGTLVPIGDNVEFVMGYNASDNVNTASTGPLGHSGKLTAPISFNARLLREILKANSELLNQSLKVSEKGLLWCGFESRTFTAQYYLIKVICED